MAGKRHLGYPILCQYSPPDIPTPSPLIRHYGALQEARWVVARFGHAVRVVDAAIRGCGAVHAGLAAARGEVIQWLDADDVLEPWKVERQLEHLLETNTDIVWGPFWTYEPVGTAFKRRLRRQPTIGDDIVAGIERRWLGADGCDPLSSTRAPSVTQIRRKSSSRGYELSDPSCVCRSAISPESGKLRTYESSATLL
jgi:hypothetical protein